MQLYAAMTEYLSYLKENGKSERTLYTYNKDAQQILAFFGERSLDELTKPWVGKFLKSDELLKLPDGKERAKPTINKTIGFLRRFLLWCEGKKLISESIVPSRMLGKKAATE